MLQIEVDLGISATGALRGNKVLNSNRMKLAFARHLDSVLVLLLGLKPEYRVLSSNREALNKQSDRAVTLSDGG